MTLFIINNSRQICLVSNITILVAEEMINCFTMKQAYVKQREITKNWQFIHDFSLVKYSNKKQNQNHVKYVFLLTEDGERLKIVPDK